MSVSVPARIYATLEIRPHKLLFTVLKVVGHKTMVVFQKTENKKDFLNHNFVVNNVQQTANKVKEFVDQYERTHEGFQICKVALILPSEKIQIKEAYEKINIALDDQPTPVTKDKIKQLKNVASAKPSTNQNVILQSRSLSWSVDHMSAPLNRICQFSGKELSAIFQNYEMNNAIVNSHHEVVEKANLTILFLTHAINELYRVSVNPISKNASTLIINWGEKQIEAGMFIEGIMKKHSVIPFGLNQVLETVAKQLKIKETIAETYLFNLLNFASNNFNDSLVLQTFSKIETYKKLVKYTGEELKNIVTQTLNTQYEEIKSIFEIFSNAHEIITYNFGSIQKIIGAEEVLKKGNAIASDYVFNEFFMGANNNYHLNIALGTVKSLEQLNNMKKEDEDLQTSVGIIPKQYAKPKNENTIFKSPLTLGGAQIQQQGYFLMDEGILIDKKPIYKKKRIG
ncbi:hypothetical protein [Williamsoniiplasma lucivorax]|uniref:Cell division protein FtsA n=1 Tax=Williamsoniiplasma lucivorax TaxID=209274 RepID=A0A2S5RDR2_9MOLU|nr:hypothetical protein [Williamsoniiplasma lucivorax]PPE05450.1 cell division protein FtsA [Williamsoniiplasma lucivorax]